MKTMLRILDRILDYTAYIAAAIVVGMMLLVSFQVLVRAWFRFQMVWTIEIIQYSLVVMAFIGAAWLLRKEGHVVMDFVLNRLNERRRNWLNAYTSIFCALLCLLIFYFGLTITVDYFKINYRYQGTIEFPAWMVQLIVPLGTFMLFIQFIRRANGYWKKASVPQKKEAKVAEKT